MHRHAEVGRVDHQSVTDVNSDVTDVGEEENEVAWLQVAAGHVHAGVPQVAGVVRQRDALLRVRPYDQTGAVECAWAGRAPHVGIAFLGDRLLQGLGTDRVRGRDADLRVLTGLREDRHGLLHRRAVDLIDLRVDGLLLDVHLGFDGVHLGDLLVSGLLIAQRLGHLAAQRVYLHPAGLIEFGDRGSLAEELLRVPGGERLERRVEPGVHVVRGGQLGHRLLADR